jgi:hypothetical protein
VGHSPLEASHDSLRQFLTALRKAERRSVQTLQRQVGCTPRTRSRACSSGDAAAGRCERLDDAVGMVQARMPAEERMQDPSAWRPKPTTRQQQVRDEA